MSCGFPEFVPGQMYHEGRIVLIAVLVRRSGVVLAERSIIGFPGSVRSTKSPN